LCSRRNSSRTCGDAIRAGAVQLRQAAARRAPEDSDANRATPGRLLDRTGVARALEEDRDVLVSRF
jgi:hypothetical protein